MELDELEKKSRAYALKNAIAYKGKANQGAVMSGLFNEGLKKDEIKNYAKNISEIVKSVNEISVEEQKKEFEKIKDLVSEREVREGLRELPDVGKKGVIMRFAPSASGPMHIGHALTSCISYLYFKKYGGKFYLRIEDTNPENVYEDSYKLLKEDAKWLFDGESEVVIQSERMDLYLGYAVSLLEKGKAYVCKCEGDVFRELASKKKDCPCRVLDVEENILRWEKMMDKNGYKSGEAVLRFKSDMKHKNPAMRDFPLARINESLHPHLKGKQRVWPLMNLAVATDDIEMNMTHIIRGKDHRDNAERQKMIFDVFNKEYPWTGFLGRIHFKDLNLSTSEFRQGISEGKYSGWDDEKLPTLISLRKKGYKPEAFWKLAEHIGLSEVDKTFSKKDFFELLDNFNKK